MRRSVYLDDNYRKKAKDGAERTKRCLACETLEPRCMLALDVLNLGLQPLTAGEQYLQYEGNLLGTLVAEEHAGMDLNGDGDASDSALFVRDDRSGLVRNLGLGMSLLHSDQFQVEGDHVALLVSEKAQGATDLNGDGDADDYVIHVYDALTGQTTNLGLAVDSFDFQGDYLALGVSERSQGGVDLNGDGDALDTVLHVYDVSTGMLRNTGSDGFDFLVEGRYVTFHTFEQFHGETDLNGDGDAFDRDVVQVYDIATQTTTNLALTGGFQIDGDIVAVAVVESDQANQDFNGDGDASDFVLHVHNLNTGATTNLGLDAGSGFTLDRDTLAFVVHEGRQGLQDLNGDGDHSDVIVHVYNVTDASLENLGYAVTTNGIGGGGVQIADGRLAFYVRESSQGFTDLNGDGDTSDFVGHIYDIATRSAVNLRFAMTGSVEFDGKVMAAAVSEGGQGNNDLNGDGDTVDSVMHVFDARTGAATNLQLAGSLKSLRRELEGSLLVYAVSESKQGGIDLNEDGDANDDVLHVFSTLTGESTNFQKAVSDLALNGSRLAFTVPEFAQGGVDLNGDGDISDRVLHLIDLAFLLPDPVAILEQVTTDVQAIQLPTGIRRSLTAKLDGALARLLDPNAGAQKSTIGKLDALIHELKTLREQEILPEEADKLISDVRHVIELLEAELIAPF